MQAPAGLICVLLGCQSILKCCVVSITQWRLVEPVTGLSLTLPATRTIVAVFRLHNHNRRHFLFTVSVPLWMTSSSVNQCKVVSGTGCCSYAEKPAPTLNVLYIALVAHSNNNNMHLLLEPAAQSLSSTTENVPLHSTQCDRLTIACRPLCITVTPPQPL